MGKDKEKNFRQSGEASDSGGRPNGEKSGKAERSAEGSKQESRAPDGPEPDGPASQPPGEWSVFTEVFRESLRSAPWVFKKATLNFGLIWIFFAAPAIILINYFGLGDFPAFPALESILSERLSSHSGAGRGGPFSVKNMMLFNIHLLELCFIIFIVPYFVYAFINKEKGRDAVKFRDFAAATVFPLVINHIKAFFVILGFFVLLIIPGVIKYFRLAFVTPATFFDEDCLKKRQSALQASSELTKGHFWKVVLFFLSIFLLSLVFSALASLTGGLLFLPFKGMSLLAAESGTDIFVYGCNFYKTCFVLTASTHFYFALVKIKDRRKAASSGGG